MAVHRNKSDRIEARVKPALKDLFMQRAEAEGRTLTQHLEHLIRQDAIAARRREWRDTKIQTQVEAALTHP